jgi:hypothetical protein
MTSRNYLRFCHPLIELRPPRAYEQKAPTSKDHLEELLKRNANAFEEWRYHY